MLSIKEAIVVEGRYDKNTLAQLVDTMILETRGFGIFSDAAALALLRRLAQTRGLIVLTDSDGAGFVIRNYLKGALPAETLKHAYIPDVYGKERRKKTWGKEKKLGVEGMPSSILEDSLRRAGATFLEPPPRATPASTAPPQDVLSHTELYLLGLSGQSGSAALRARLLQRLDLPAHLSTKAMLPVLAALYNKEDLLRMVEELRQEAPS